MKFERTTLAGSIPVFQHDKAFHLAQGGFNLVTTGLAAGTVVPSGTVLGYDEANRTATIIKGATVVENVAADGVSIKVDKNHILVVGDVIAATADAAAITAIDKTNENYDTITVDATLGAITAGAGVYQAAAAGADPEFPVEPKGLLYNPVKVVAGDVAFVDVVLRCTVYARRIPYVAPSIQEKLSNIFFSQSF